MSENKKILIVDDEPDILKAVVFRIKKAGYETVLATDGQEGLEKARAEKPDLILLDWRLPVMNGGEVYQHLQSDNDLKGIPVIILTASRESEDLAVRMREIGVEHVLTKPYEPEELLAEIEKLLG